MTLTRENKRLIARGAFFVLFVLAPPLNIFRLDLTLGHFIFFGMPWTLGLAAFQAGEITALEATGNLLLRGFLPIAAVAGVVIWASWKYGRIYCGWLCPHFSVVETINGLMRRATGKPTLWEKTRLPARRADGRVIEPNARYGWLVVAAVLGFAFLWALTLLTYLLPPREIYHNLFTFALTRNQAIFLGAATTVFTIEFFAARHLFCRFGCAVGAFQSIAWMANPNALVVRFDGARAAACAECNSACDNDCPMRLKPRNLKRLKFTCTQCGQCLNACESVQRDNPRGSLLTWVADEAAKVERVPRRITVRAVEG
jgi:polyferredoxin